MTDCTAPNSDCGEPEPRFTLMRAADGRRMRVPLVPGPDATTDNGQLWPPSPPLWLLPAQYRPPDCEPPDTGGRSSSRPRGRPRKDHLVEPPERLSPEMLLKMEFDAFLPLDWRWRLAGHHVAIDEPPRPGDDQLLLAWYYRLARSRCRCEDDYQRLADWLPEVHQAITIRQHRPLLLELEARILAKEPLEKIGGKLAVAAKTLATYAGLFFDVHRFLHAYSWVMHQAIRYYDELPKEPLEQLGRLWKYYGFWGGPLLLDDLIYGTTEQKHPRSAEQVRQFLRDDAIKIIQHKANLALRLLPVDDPKTFWRLMRGQQRIMQLNQRQQQQKKKQGPEMNIQPNIQAMLDAFPPGWSELVRKQDQEKDKRNGA